MKQIRTDYIIDGELSGSFAGALCDILYDDHQRCGFFRRMFVHQCESPYDREQLNSAFDQIESIINPWR